MDTKIAFLYLSEPDMIAAGVKDMPACVDCMEDLLVTLEKGDYVMGGENHNSHGCMIMFPDDPKFPGMPKNGEDRRFMAMPAYLGGRYQMAGMKWYGSNMDNKAKGLPRSILMMMLNDKDTGAPIHRLFNRWFARDTHLFTTDKSEHDNLVKIGRSGEGIALHAME